MGSVQHNGRFTLADHDTDPEVIRIRGEAAGLRAKSSNAASEADRLQSVRDSWTETADREIEQHGQVRTAKPPVDDIADLRELAQRYEPAAAIKDDELRHAVDMFHRQKMHEYDKQIEPHMQNAAECVAGLLDNLAWLKRADAEFKGRQIRCGCFTIGKEHGTALVDIAIEVGKAVESKALDDALAQTGGVL